MKQTFPIFDKRDGRPHHELAYKTFTEILGIRWNAWLDRSISGIYSDHETHLRRLIRTANRKGETILAASYSNCAVSIAVAPIIR